MESKKRYNSDGEELFHTESGVWLPKKAIPSKEDLVKYYARFEHPKINFLLLGFLMSLCIIFCIALILLLKKYIGFGYSLLVMFGFTLVFALIHINKLAILSIKLYQHFAPMRIRERCVFTPTCSSYAIQAIKKYGVFKSIHLIKDRIKRCHGEDREDPLK